MRSVVIIGAAVGTVAVCAAVGLLSLSHSVSSYRSYWQDRARGQGEIVYVALGDSAAQGIGASRPQHGYVGLLADSIGDTTGRPVRVINLSVTGATVRDVLDKQIPEMLKLQPDIDLVTMDIGANDVTHRTPDGEFQRDYEAILQALPPGRSVIGDVPYFGGRLRNDPAVRQANIHINRLAGEYKITVAPLYAELKPRQSPWIYATDLFHPNNRGYRIWHDAYWQHVGPLAEDLATPRSITI